MPLSITCILLIFALIGTIVGTIVSGMGKAPLWVPVLLINIAALLQCLPR